MDDFPGNSHERRQAVRSEPEDTATKKVERVTKGVAKKARKSLGKKFLEVFVGGDAKGVIEYILVDVLIPALKDALVDAATQGIERTLFGDSRQNRRPSNSYRQPTNYSSYSRSYNQPQPRREEPRRNARPPSSSYTDLVLPSRADADEVLERMYDLIDKYGKATVADLYELTGISSQFTDQKWGWEILDGNQIRRVPEGYLLDLPRPEALN
jgi:hypothetical protein